MYVAITRAKHHLHISCSETRSHYGQQEGCQRSQFVSEIPKKLLHIVNEIYEPPKKKLNVVKQTTMSQQNQFVTAKNLMNVDSRKKKK